MDHWLGELRQALDALHDVRLLRGLWPIEHHGRFVVKADGKRLVNLASNDYLGLASHPSLIEAAIKAASTYGTGAGASRLAGGTTPLHAEVERRFAEFKHAQAALLFPTGYMANHSVLTALTGDKDLVCLDKLSHASLIDAAHACRAQVRVFPHLGYEKLERLLADAMTERDGSAPPRRLIVTDSVFSMDGDVADLPRLCELADRYDAILIVDEAHGTGVLGATGAGLCEHQGVSERVDVVISTASKAMGCLGGIVTARQEVIDTLMNVARSFIYTTAIPPGQAAVIGAAVEVIQNEPARRDRLAALSSELRNAITGLTIAHGNSHLDRNSGGGRSVVTPIIPLIAGTPEAALALAGHLETAGFFAPAIRPPTVPPGTSRVRLSLRADMDDADLFRLIDAIRRWHTSSPER